jgi:uncharacterized protein
MDLSLDVKVGDTPILFREIQPPIEGQSGYDGSEKSTTLLRAGYRKTQNARPFLVDTIFEKNVDIPLRDGTILKADIFRPGNDNTHKVPALLPWSPYGKSGRGMVRILMRLDSADVDVRNNLGYASW